MLNPGNIVYLEVNYSKIRIKWKVVSHIGKKATDGHYVCDIRVGDKEWLHFDDSSVYSTKFQDVLNKVAYLLLYERV